MGVVAMGTDLKGIGYKVKFENSQTNFSNVSNSGGRQVSVTVETHLHEGYTLLTVHEQHGNWRDTDHFSYRLKLNENAGCADVLGWLCGLPEYAASSVLKHLKESSKLVESECQSVSTDIDYFNPWSGKFMDEKEKSDYIDQQKKTKQVANKSSSLDLDNELDTWQLNAWRDVYTIPDPRLFEE